MKTIIVAIVFVILIAALYIAAYASLVQPDPQGKQYDADYEQIAARYRIGDDVCQYVFAPAEFLDRRIRPQYWRFACVW